MWSGLGVVDGDFATYQQLNCKRWLTLATPKLVSFFCLGENLFHSSISHMKFVHHSIDFDNIGWLALFASAISKWMCKQSFQSADAMACGFGELSSVLSLQCKQISTFFTHFAPIMPLSIDFPCHKQMPFSWQRKKYTLWIRCFAYIIVATVEQELFHVNIYGYPLKIGENPRVENEINQTSRHWLRPSFDCYYTLTHIQLIFSYKM